MYAKLRDHWYILPTLSGVLLTLTFHPFNLWPLSFVALAPLFYFVAGFPDRSRWQIFWGGFVTAGLFSFFLSYFTIIQFQWLPEAYLFSNAVRFMVIPITLISGSAIGALFAFVYKPLRTSSVFLNALLAATLYAGPELILWYVFGGYYLAFLGYAVSSIPFLLSFASLGGASAVSFIVAWVSGLIAEGLASRDTRVTLQAAAVSFLLVLLVGVPNWIYLHRTQPVTDSLSVSLIQIGDRTKVPFGKMFEGGFTAPELAGFIREAGKGNPDLVIYPFSPVEGSLYRTEAPTFNKGVLVASESAFAEWQKPLVSSSTTLLTWNDVYADSVFYNQYQTWKNGALISEYKKRDLFPFMDYTPQWARKVGFFSTPFDVVPGEKDNTLVIGGITLGSLMCSELQQPGLGRSEAKRAPLILAVGSEAMFIDSVASEFMLRAAQFRATENNTPVIRGNVLGPSGIIKGDGSFVTRTNVGEEGIMRGVVELHESRPTLFSVLGSLPTTALLIGVLYVAYIQRKKLTH